MTAPLSSPDPFEAHPSVDELADLAEELVEPAAAEELRRHLDGCADCRETSEALAELGTLLGEVPAPVMPADVAARLDAALAAAAADTDADAPATRARSAAEAPDGPHRAAAPPGRPQGPTTPAQPATTPVAPPARRTAATSPAGPGRPRPRRRRAALLIGAATALLAVGLGGALLLRPAEPRGADASAVRAGAPVATGAAAGSATGPAEPKLSTAGTVYQDELLAAQARQLLAGTTTDGPAKPFSPSAAPPAAGEQGLTGGGGTPACRAPGAGPLLATGHGSYAGAPAELLVYGVPGRPEQLDVYLREPDCGPVLLQRTVAAH
ncbi:zf-HC2 domain-containing protein [Kitasatospora sp. NPDC059327]|uniref:zf-HC2 domain-containing protein n=1 Tax=Kitasatospora sp. NPDC059327 TaxID=3346803 RepID=UPI0036B4C173